MMVSLREQRLKRRFWPLRLEIPLLLLLLFLLPQWKSVSSGQFSRSCSYLILSLVLSIPIFYFNISQQCCIPLGLLIQSQADQSAHLPIYLSLACMTDAYIFCVWSHLHCLWRFQFARCILPPGFLWSQGLHIVYSRGSDAAVLVFCTFHMFSLTILHLCRVTWKL